MTGRLGTTLFNQTHVISIQHLPSTPSTLSTVSTISTPNTDSTLSLYYLHYLYCNCILSTYISNLSVAPVSCFNIGTETRNNFLSQTFLAAARQRRGEKREGESVSGHITLQGRCCHSSTQKRTQLIHSIHSPGHLTTESGKAELS